MNKRSEREIDLTNHDKNKKNISLDKARLYLKSCVLKYSLLTSSGSHKGAWANSIPICLSSMRKQVQRSEVTCPKETSRLLSHRVTFLPGC